MDQKKIINLLLKAKSVELKINLIYFRNLGDLASVLRSRLRALRCARWLGDAIMIAEFTV
ncbi:MAG: hypothetical protein QXN24_02520 [Candidatus Bathyarchaeia archaeon]